MARAAPHAGGANPPITTTEMHSNATQLPLDGPEYWEKSLTSWT